jgi:shikimate kinase
MPLPPLYPITDGRGPESLAGQIRRLGAAGFPLVQFRGKPLAAGAQWLQLREALAAARAQGSWPAICVNDRADLAVLAALDGLPPWGLHLGQDDLPPSEAARLPGLAGLHLGTSTHRPGEWQRLDPACDHAGIGPFRATATKGDHAEPVGLAGLASGCRALGQAGIAPVAIGGLTLADGPDCFRAGAEALAMVGAVAASEAPGELLWTAQLQRWQARPPIRPGQGLVLVGGSGAGKTTLGRVLAARLGLPFLDSDHEIQTQAGQTIPAIFAQDGEPGFRAREAAWIAGALAAPAVLALGAGAWEDPDTRARVRAAGFQVLWLAEVPERAWSRVQGDRLRPLAQDRENFMNRWAQRSRHWWEAALLLPLGRSPEVLAEAVAHL